MKNEKGDDPISRRIPDISSSGLHILAMLFMLLDHMWATVTPGHEWMTAVGRMAFPIFAFMIVEGYFHTHDLKKYFLRMLLFAVVSEIPFDLMYGSMPFYPHHQNVLWTFLISMSGIYAIESVKVKQKLWLTILTSVGVLLVGYLLGIVLAVDYYESGILTVLIFYFFRGRKWWCLLGQFLCLYWLNAEILGGFCYVVSVFGNELWIPRQALAVLALFPIWMYRGRQGYHSKPFQYFCYAFYPVHILILALL